MFLNPTENSQRFSGLADIYNQARPSLPEYPLHILTRYLEHKPRLVVDIGCGTGLSTSAWQDYAEKVIGIEPNDDMLRVAKKLENDKVSFIHAYSHATNLAAESADMVVCSQSFHWMEPKTTLAEIQRILRPKGLFAALDYDWPPVCRWPVEKAGSELTALTKQIEKEHTEGKPGILRWDKSNHLDNLRASKLFRYTRELVFANTITCRTDRLYTLALSQSGMQFVLNHCPERIEAKLAEYKDLLDHTYGEHPFEADFCYRMRIGIK